MNPEQQMAIHEATRKSLQAQIKHLEEYVMKKADGKDIDALQTRKVRVADLMKNFTYVESQMFQVNPEVKSMAVEFSEVFYNVDSRLSKLIRLWNEQQHDGAKINDTLSTSLSMPNAHLDIRLPKITIEPFAGNYTQWQQFYDLYLKTIHNSSLTAVQKFTYLKGYLRDEAANLIKHFPVTEANYFEAFKKLVDRYGRKKHTINAFIRSFLDQPIIRIATSGHIRKLLDVSDETIRGLKSLGEQAESRDVWLLYLMEAKLDSESKLLWAQHSCEIDNPSVEQFFKFLLNRSDALEAMKYASSRDHSSSVKSTKSFVATNTIKCLLCSGEHYLSDCNKFKQMSVRDRRECVKAKGCCFNCLRTNHAVFKCRVKTRCALCCRKHSTLLHMEDEIGTSSKTMAPGGNQSNSLVNKTKIDSRSNLSTIDSPETLSYQGAISSKSTILPTALVKITDIRGIEHTCRILLDTGSMSSFISEKCCNQLGLVRKHNRTIVSGIGGSSSQTSCGEVQVNLRSFYDSTKECSVQALVLAKLCNRLPSHSTKLNKIKCSVFLADPEFSRGGRIDMIIGVQLVFGSLLSGRLKINEDMTAVETIYGWVLGGEGNNIKETQIYLAEATDSKPIDQIDELLQKFWQVEAMAECQKLTAEEVRCEDIFRTTTSRTEDGRFVIRLPVKQKINQLGASLNLALSRQASLERKFSRQQSFATSYKSFIQEYVDLGHMAQVNCDGSKNYLPHHGVIKESSTTTKLRVVFDGSARTASGISLNESLLAGSIRQASLYQILLRFREFKIAMVCDVEKMYRQILVHQDDRNLQQIVWRAQPTDSMMYFELLTLTYGMRSAPYLATRVLEELAQLNENKYPDISSILRKHTYIDDVMTGGCSLDEAMKKRVELIKVLGSAGMRLRKWVSNSTELLKLIPECDKENLTKDIQDESLTTKVLGLQWSPEEDVFNYKIELGEYIPTKRGLLSESSRIFDPLGWLAPVVLRIKIIFQKLWLTGISWDDPLPEAVESEWLAIRSKLTELRLVKISRWLELTSGTELHGFCDASKNAYAGVVYARHQRVNGEWCIKLIASKSRVAPIKTLTIARLELCGALLLVELMKSVEESLCTATHNKFYWTDSTIVLNWLSDVPNRWEVFVANRTSKILEDTRRENWFHVPTKSNAADCASRGLWPGELVNNHLWWDGPTWLMNKEEWPKQRSYETKPTLCLIEMEENEDWLETLSSRVSSFHTIIKIVSRLKRLFKNARSSNRSHKIVGIIQREELTEAELVCWKHQQKRLLKEDVANLTKSLPITSNLKFLNPFIDEDGVVRVGGRLQNANVPDSVKHPIIVPQKTKLGKRLVEYFHTKYRHAGSQLLLGLLRQKYWLIRGKDVIRMVIRKCVNCFKANPVAMGQQMGNLPSYRVEHLRPFIRVGVDFAGPFMVYLKRGRGQKSIKVYICLFVCESSKAVHIELVSDLTTGAFLAAFRRFVGRRGLSTDVFSDCGTNFIGANKELQQLFKFIKNNTNEIYYALLKDNINWHFMPPNAPHFGGLWEAAVKSFKYHFKRVVGATVLTMEEMMTLAVEIEAIMNSRPLCGVPNDEYDILTPAHFLLGHSMVLVPEYDLRECPMNKLDRWQLIQKRKQHFWTRWSLEYLTALQTRYKWQTIKKNIQIDDVVLIIDNNLPPTKWLMGRIIEIIRGKDGLVRVTNIQTRSGVLKRPIHKLCRLPFESTDSRPGECLK